MTKPGTIPFGQAMAPSKGPAKATKRTDATTEQLWHEHGWGLGGVGTAALVLAVLLASFAARLLG